MTLYRIRLAEMDGWNATFHISKLNREQKLNKRHHDA